jgi:hypothetical protein
MKTFQRFIVASSLCLGCLSLSGCGSKELGPADPSKVPVVDPSVVEKAMNQEEAKKYLPKGAKPFNPGVMPEAAPSK